ncbi:MAG: hypothetical protein KGZ39_00690 [Simkania sp.]|nr:hypothetical protein [Simkania sp.]
MKKDKQNVKKLDSAAGREPYKKDLFTEFIGWSVMTNEEKERVGIISAKIFAKKHSIHESQLSRWKQRSDFHALKMQTQRNKLRDLTPDVLAAFHKRCTKYGMASDIELWLALVEEWDKKKVIEQKPALEFGPNDIRALIKNLPLDKQKLYYQTLARLIADATQAEDRSRNEL